ncbi:hypothetical protein FGO68_gene14821 [Halteria grandinella]|uniref:Uncharacterized protein n=1 Tax=Halteria grandinella TaxID=5974 RepID=A0A8J8P9M2_HALGN|nr:hypothetical protein FGO68_gene14821 [Halteria grandinella]
MWLKILSPRLNGIYEYINALAYSSDGETIVAITQVQGGDWKRRIILVASGTGSVTSSLLISTPYSVGAYSTAQRSLTINSSKNVALYFMEDPQAGQLTSRHYLAYFDAMLSTVYWAIIGKPGFGYLSLLKPSHIEDELYILYRSDERVYITKLQTGTTSYNAFWSASYTLIEESRSHQLQYTIVDGLEILVAICLLREGTEQNLRIAIFKDVTALSQSDPPVLYTFKALAKANAQLVDTYILSEGQFVFAIIDYETLSLELNTLSLSGNQCWKKKIEFYVECESTYQRWGRFVTQEQLYLTATFKHGIGEIGDSDITNYRSAILTTEMSKSAIGEIQSLIQYSFPGTEIAQDFVTIENSINQFYEDCQTVEFQIDSPIPLLHDVTQTAFTPQTNFFDKPQITGFVGAPQIFDAVYNRLAVQPLAFTPFTYKSSPSGTQCETGPPIAYTLQSAHPFISISGTTLLVAYTLSTGPHTVRVVGSVGSISDYVDFTVNIIGTAPSFESNIELWDVKLNLVETYMYMLPGVLPSTRGFNIEIEGLTDVTVKYLPETHQLILLEKTQKLSAFTGHQFDFTIKLSDEQYPAELYLQQAISLTISTNSKVKCEEDPYPKWLLCKDQIQQMQVLSITVPDSQSRFAFAVNGQTNDLCMIGEGTGQGAFIALYGAEMSDLKHLLYFKEDIVTHIMQLSFSPDEGKLAVLASGSYQGIIFLLRMDPQIAVIALRKLDQFAISSQEKCVLQLSNIGAVYFAGSAISSDNGLLLKLNLITSANQWAQEIANTQKLQNMKVQQLADNMEAFHLSLYNPAYSELILSRFIFDQNGLMLANQAQCVKRLDVVANLIIENSQTILDYKYVISDEATWVVAAFQVYDATNSRTNSLIMASLYSNSAVDPEYNRQFYHSLGSYSHGILLDGIIDTNYNYCQLQANYGEIPQYLLILYPFTAETFQPRLFTIEFKDYNITNFNLAQMSTRVFGKLRRGDLHFYIAQNRWSSDMTEIILNNDLTAEQFATIYTSDNQASCLQYDYVMTLQTVDAVIDSLIFDISQEGEYQTSLVLPSFLTIANVADQALTYQSSLVQVTAIDHKQRLADRDSYVENCIVPKIEAIDKMQQLDYMLETPGEGIGYYLVIPNFEFKWTPATVKCATPITSYSPVSYEALESFLDVTGVMHYSYSNSPSLYLFTESTMQLLIRNLVPDLPLSLTIRAYIKTAFQSELRPVEGRQLTFTFTSSAPQYPNMPPRFSTHLLNWAIYADEGRQDYLLPTAQSERTSLYAPKVTYSTVPAYIQDIIGGFSVDPSSMAGDIEGAKVTVTVYDNPADPGYLVHQYQEYSFTILQAQTLTVSPTWKPTCFAEPEPHLLTCPEGDFTASALYVSKSYISVGGSAPYKCIDSTSSSDVKVPVFMVFNLLTWDFAIELKLIQGIEEMTVTEITMDEDENQVAMLIEKGNYQDAYLVLCDMQLISGTLIIRGVKKAQGKRMVIDRKGYLMLLYGVDNVALEYTRLLRLQIDGYNKEILTSTVPQSNFLFELVRQPDPTSEQFVLGYKHAGVDNIVRFSDDSPDFSIIQHMRIAETGYDFSNQMLVSFDSQSFYIWQALSILTGTQSLFFSIFMMQPVEYQTYVLDFSPASDSTVFNLLDFEVVQENPQFILAESDKSHPGQLTGLFYGRVKYNLILDLYYLEVKRMHYMAEGVNYNVMFIPGQDVAIGLFQLGYLKIRNGGNEFKVTTMGSALIKISTNDINIPFQQPEQIGISAGISLPWSIKESSLFNSEATIFLYEYFNVEMPSLIPTMIEETQIAGQILDRIPNMEQNYLCGNFCPTPRQYDIVPPEESVITIDKNFVGSVYQIEPLEFENPRCFPENLQIRPFDLPPDLCFTISDDQSFDFSLCTPRFDYTFTLRASYSKVYRDQSYRIARVINQGLPRFSDESFQREFYAEEGDDKVFSVDFTGNLVIDSEMGDADEATIEYEFDQSGMFNFIDNKLTISVTKYQKAGTYTGKLILNDHYPYDPLTNEYLFTLIIYSPSIPYFPKEFRVIYNAILNGYSLEGIVNPIGQALNYTRPLPPVLALPQNNSSLNEDFFQSILNQLNLTTSLGQATIPQLPVILEYLRVTQILLDSNQAMNTTSLTHYQDNYTSAILSWYNQTSSQYSLYLISDLISCQRLMQILTKGLKGLQQIDMEIVKSKKVSNTGKLVVMFGYKCKQIIRMIRGDEQMRVSVENEDGRKKIEYEIRERGPDYIKIELMFEKPENISMGQEKDKVRIEIMVDLITLERELTVVIKRGTSQLFEVPPQIDEGLLQIVETVMRATTIASFVLISGNALVNIFISGAMNQLYGLLNCLGSLTILTLIPINIPGPARIISKAIVSFSQFDILPSQLIIEKLGFKFMDSSQDSLNDELEDLGFDQKSTTRNMGSAVIFLAILLQTMGTFPLLHVLIPAKYVRIKQLSNSLMTKLFWSLPLRYIFSQFLTLFLASLIYFDNRQPIEYSGDQLDQLLSHLFIGLCTLFPFGAFFILIIKAHTHKDWIQRFDSLYQDLKTQTLEQSACSTLEIVKLQITIVVLLYMRDYPALQIMVLFYISMLYQAYLIYYRPYQARSQNFLQFLNEFLVTVYLITLITLTDYQQVSNFKIFSGWALIANYAFCFTINISVIVVNFLKGICLLIHKKVRNIASRGDNKAKKYAEERQSGQKQASQTNQSLTRVESSEHLVNSIECNGEKAKQKQNRQPYQRQKKHDTKTI